MNEDELMRLENSEEEGEVTANDPLRYRDMTPSEIDAMGKDDLGLVEAYQNEQKLELLQQVQAEEQAKAENPQGFLPNNPVQFVSEKSSK